MTDAVTAAEVETGAVDAVQAVATDVWASIDNPSTT